METYLDEQNKISNSINEQSQLFGETLSFAFIELKKMRKEFAKITEKEVEQIVADFKSGIITLQECQERVILALDRFSNILGSDAINKLKEKINNPKEGE